MKFFMKKFNDTPLILACANGNEEIVQLLLKQKDIDINYKNILMQNNL